MKKKVHYNPAQLLSALVDAPEEYSVLGRGTGKTEGILAPKIARRIKEMPRSTRVLIGATFQQILTRTLPPLVEGWRKMGYLENVHFVVGKRPPEKWKNAWNWKGPYRPPFKYDYVISWYNGAVQQMVSQDRIGSTNGMSVDGIDGDEGKLLNRDRFHSETLPANRGIIKEFADNPHHHGITITTDMPIGTAGKWILEKEMLMNNTAVRQIKIIQLKINQILSSDSIKQSDYRLIETARRQLNDLRRNLVFYQEGSTLLNIHALGIDYIKQMNRNLSSFEMQTSILGRKPLKLENGFYPDWDEERHGYFAYDYHFFKNTGYDLGKISDQDNATVDDDYNEKEAFHISLDYNVAICPMVCAQIDKGQVNVIKAVNTFYSLYPEKLQHTVEKFLEYYKNHKKKIVYYWYDQTATNEYAHTSSTQADEVISLLRKKGWTVIPRYFGVASGHERRYTMYGHLLEEDDYYRFVFRYNRDRCNYLALSCMQAPVKVTRKGFGKNKSSELLSTVDARESTHFSEALDMMIWGILESGMNWAETNDAGASGIYSIDLI